MKTMALIAICSASLVSCQLEEDPGTNRFSNLVGEAELDSSCSGFEALASSFIEDWDASSVGNGGGVDYESVPVSLEVARSLSTNSEMAFSGYDAVGREAYFNHAEKIGIKYSAEEGYYKYVTPPLPDEEDLSSSNYSDEDAVADTNVLWNGLGLPEEERDSLYSTGIGVADIGPGGEKYEGRTVARHVRVTRKINGIRAIDSEFTCEYMLNGRLIYFKVRWPSFKLPENDGMKSPEEARAAIAKRLCDSKSELEDIKNGHSELVYRYRKGGYHEPVLEVTFDNAKGETAIFYEYSLLTGFLY